MPKTIWQKIKQNRFLLMTLCCVAPILVGGALVSFFFGTKYLILLVLLLCPLMHFLMMRGHKHDNSCEHEKNNKENI